MRDNSLINKKKGWKEKLFGEKKIRDWVLLLQEDRDDCERVIMVRDDTIGLGALSRVAFSCSGASLAGCR